MVPMNEARAQQPVQISVKIELYKIFRYSRRTFFLMVGFNGRKGRLLRYKMKETKYHAGPR